MRDVAGAIANDLNYLRRYARALTGTQAAGDAYVRVCLEVLLRDRACIKTGAGVRLQLFKLFHEVWTSVDQARGQNAKDGGSVVMGLSVAARLEALAPRERQILLLTTLEGFSEAEAAFVLGITETMASELLEMAWTAVNNQLATTVLVIEDEPIIALDIASLVVAMGHKVAGVAANEREALTMARAKDPGLVLADIELGAGGSGSHAVARILQSIDVPVIYVTAFPERLLTGERPEPTYLVTKPFEPRALRVAISQALSSREPAVDKSASPNEADIALQANA